MESDGPRAGNLVMKVLDADVWENYDSVFKSKIESEPPVNSFRTDG